MLRLGMILDTDAPVPDSDDCGIDEYCWRIGCKIGIAPAQRKEFAWTYPSGDKIIRYLVKFLRSGPAKGGLPFPFDDVGSQVLMLLNIIPRKTVFV